MATKASPTAIGGFVIGAIALIVIGLIVFGGGQFFVTKKQFVAYFPGSVQGLRVGAPVTFRGAQIGQVTNISVVFPAERGDEPSIPVVFEILKDRFVYAPATGSTFDDMDSEEELREVVDAGLRAQLMTQSMVTGLLYVDLGFHPDTEAHLAGGSRYSNLLELPTIEATLDQFQQSVGDALKELPGLFANANRLLTTLGADFGAAGEDFRDAVSHIQSITARLDERTGTIDQILENLTNATATAEAILEDNEQQIGALITGWAETAGSVQRMADQINDAIAENRQGLEDFTTVGLYEWTGLAQDAQAAVAQFQRVAEELERDPSRFLFGGQETGVRPEE